MCLAAWQLCGIPKAEWATDRWFVEPLQQNQQPRWRQMRGSRYRVGFRLSSSGLDDARRPMRLQDAIQDLSRVMMSDWGCQEKQPERCSYSAGRMRSCAQRLRVEVRYSFSSSFNACSNHPFHSSAITTSILICSWQSQESSCFHRLDQPCYVYHVSLYVLMSATSSPTLARYLSHQLPELS